MILIHKNVERHKGRVQGRVWEKGNCGGHEKGGANEGLPFASCFPLIFCAGSPRTMMLWAPPFLFLLTQHNVVACVVQPSFLCCESTEMEVQMSDPLPSHFGNMHI